MSSFFLTIALFLALWCAIKLFSLNEKLGRLTYSVDYLEQAVRDLRKDVTDSLQITRKHLAKVSKGESVHESMLLEGVPWVDLPADQVKPILENEPSKYFVLDVRTDQEYKAGHLASASNVPVDELKARKFELPQNLDTPLCVYCQSGGRSGAACEILASMGYSDILHLATGFGSWTGEVKK